MSDAIVVAILSLIGTAIGSVVSVLTANRLTNYKIDALQKQVEKHNQIVERTYYLEEKTSIAEQRIQSIEKRVDKIEEEL